jgi:hypothetical protein
LAALEDDEPTGKETKGRNEGRFAAIIRRIRCDPREVGFDTVNNQEYFTSMTHRGRPKMDLEQLMVRLFAGQKERIDAAVGTNRRSEFIRKTIEAELQRLEARRQDAKPRQRTTIK